MTNLTDKFEAFQQLATAQHTALMARLQYTNDLLGSALLGALNANNSKLDAIIVALNALSDGKSLLSIQNSIDDDGNATRVVIQRIIDRLGYNPPNKLADDMSIIARQLTYQTEALYGTANPGTDGNHVLLNDLHYLRTSYANVTGLDSDADRTILYYIALLQQALGLPTGDATTTLLGLLSGLQQQSLYSLQGVPPTQAAQNECGVLIISTATGDFAGRTHARFGNLYPSDRRYTNAFGLAPNFEISPPVGGNWTGWRAYTQTNANGYFGNPSINITAPANSWHDLSGGDNVPFAPNVDAGKFLKVFVCGPAAQTEVTIQAVRTTLSNGSQLWAIPFNGVLGLNGVTSNLDLSNSATDPIWVTTTMQYSYTATISVVRYYNTNNQSSIAVGVRDVISSGERSTAIVGSGPFAITIRIAP